MFSCRTFEVKSRCGIDQPIAAKSATFHCPPSNIPRYQVVHTSTSPVQFKHTLHLEHISNSKRVQCFINFRCPCYNNCSCYNCHNNGTSSSGGITSHLAASFCTSLDWPSKHRIQNTISNHYYNCKSSKSRYDHSFVSMLMWLLTLPKAQVTMTLGLMIGELRE